MTEFFEFFAQWMNNLLALLNSVTFRIFNFNVSLLYLLLGFIFVSMMLGIFWKGAKG